MDRLGHIPGYAPLFKAAFADDANPITYQNLAKAIGAFERTLVTPSPFEWEIDTARSRSVSLLPDSQVCPNHASS